MDEELSNTDGKNVLTWEKKQKVNQRELKSHPRKPNTVGKKLSTTKGNVKVHKIPSKHYRTPSKQDLRSKSKVSWTNFWRKKNGRDALWKEGSIQITKNFEVKNWRLWVNTIKSSKRTTRIDWRPRKRKPKIEKHNFCEEFRDRSAEKQWKENVWSLGKV